MQDGYLPQNIAVAKTDFLNFGVRYCFEEQERFYFLAATKQLYEWFSPFVCLSPCPPHLFHYVPIIVSSWNFQVWVSELLSLTAFWWQQTAGSM